MRWKESFLVPDHRVREILGASFEGFYYICFNQVTGNVSGIYFHSKSEKYVFISSDPLPYMMIVPYLQIPIPSFRSCHQH